MGDATMSHEIAVLLAYFGFLIMGGVIAQTIVVEIYEHRKHQNFLRRANDRRLPSTNR